MSMHGDGDKPPSKFVVKVNGECTLDHVFPKFTVKGDERVWLYATFSNGTSKFSKVEVHGAQVEILHAAGLKKAGGNNEADDSDRFIGKPARPKAIERLPAFGFRGIVCQWVTPKFKDQVLDPLIADCDADYVEAVHKGDVAAQKRIKFKTYLWICHALFRGMISGVWGLFGRQRNSVE